MLLSTTTAGIAKKRGDKEAIRILAEAGFDAFDYAFYAHPDDSSIYGENFVEYFKNLKNFAEKCGIFCNQSHAPYHSSVGIPEKDAKIYQRIVRSMEASAVLGAKIVIVHPLQHLTYAEHPEELFEMNVAFYRSLIPYCEKFGVKVAVENMWQYNPSGHCIIDSTCSRPWEFCRYLDAIDSPWIVGCLDIGHASLVGTDIAAFIHALGNERLLALHVHDTDFAQDLHTLPFVSKIDYFPIMKALKDIEYRGEFTYEADGFLEKFPPELFPEVSQFMCSVGKYLIRYGEN